YSGLDPSAPFLQGASASGTSASADSGSVNPAFAGGVIIGAGITATHFTGAGSGFTNRVITSPDGDILEDQIVAAGGTYHAPANLSSGKWLMQVAAFAAAASGPPDTTAPTSPTNVHSMNITSNSVTLGWTGSTDNMGVAGYKVYRGGSMVGTASSPSYTDAGL